MQNTIATSIRHQLGASMDMLQNAILHCPENLWNSPQPFWYHAYHCLFFLDYYLTVPPSHFKPPAPFNFSEFDNKMPDRVYTPAELLKYLNYCRNKFHVLIQNLSLEGYEERWVNVSGTMNYSVLEILLYNMRHVQHHTGQLNLLLRQSINDAPDWIFREIYVDKPLQ